MTRREQNGAGERTHVAAAILGTQCSRAPRDQDAWWNAKTPALSCSTDTRGFALLQRYLDAVSRTPTEFVVALEPTGGYYSFALVDYLLRRGYPLLHVASTTVREYRKKLFGREDKSDTIDARVMARMLYLHEAVGEEFRITPIALASAGGLACKVLVLDQAKVRRQLVQHVNQLQQVIALTFAELKTVYRTDTACPAARDLLTRFPSVEDLAAADGATIAQVLRDAHDYTHAHRAADLRELARSSSGVRALPEQHWRRAGSSTGSPRSRLPVRNSSTRSGRPFGTIPTGRSSRAYPSAVRSGRQSSTLLSATSTDSRRRATSGPISAGGRPRNKRGRRSIRVGLRPRGCDRRGAS